MFNNYKFSVAERFMRYVQIDTQSDPFSNSFPSTEKQKNLSLLLVSELLLMGIKDASIDEFGYVIATIPATTSNTVPIICFCAHVDTAPDCSGMGVKPILHQNYNGLPIILPDDPTQIITIEQHPYLQEKIGDDIITASGTTLLGADDKAGVAIIMDMAAFLTANPAIEHGAIKILFTPDEEIGKGVDFLNVNKLGASFAYTLDGSELGSLEDENFSADGLAIHFYGVSAHPGYAKDKLINAIKIAASFVDHLPIDHLSPETTEGVKGFVHPVHIEGNVEKTTVSFIIRDFATEKLEEYAQLIDRLAAETVAKYPGSMYTIDVKEQYRNMKDVLVHYPEVAQYAEEAIQRAGLTVRKMPVRGGTDGSRLSFMGLPCPNIFTGEMAFHSKHEYVSVQDMQKSVETIVHLAQIWAEKAK
ncbi:MAG: peptidase T [Chitinophagaceae bacterium]|nr:peptidase T [Chitinophagaceae bacterium]